MQTSRWEIGSYLDSQAAMVHHLEAVFEDGDAALVTAALNDVTTAAGAGSECVLGSEPSLAEASAALKRIGLRLALRVPPSESIEV